MGRGSLHSREYVSLAPRLLTPPSYARPSRPRLSLQSIRGGNRRGGLGGIWGWAGGWGQLKTKRRDIYTYLLNYWPVFRSRRETALGTPHTQTGNFEIAITPDTSLRVRLEQVGGAEHRRLYTLFENRLLAKV